MKSFIQILFGVVFGVFLIVGCESDTMQQDAKKLAQLYCENQRFLQKVVEGDESAIEQSVKMAEKSQALVETMMEKYKTEEESRAFTELVMKEAENCSDLN